MLHVPWGSHQPCRVFFCLRWQKPKLPRSRCRNPWCWHHKGRLDIRCICIKSLNHIIPTIQTFIFCQSSSGIFICQSLDLPASHGEIMLKFQCHMALGSLHHGRPRRKPKERPNRRPRLRLHQKPRPAMIQCPLWDPIQAFEVLKGSELWWLRDWKNLAELR